jgi:8-oxo-dGTP pyrophosphatase MutT (NUDIX family)
MGTLVPRDAATVMLVRDSDVGPEVFMLRRTPNAAFVGGFFVFPGGAVDAADRAVDVEHVCDGLTDSEASEQLGLESGGLAFWVAAIRECFEEAGVLLARDASGEVVRFDDAEVAFRFSEHRAGVHRGDSRLVDLCHVEGLRLVTDAIHYVSHWITQAGEPRRFDTRFFVAQAPEAQTPLHDDVETVASMWVRPRDALARCAAGELQLIQPTIKNLELLVPHATTDDVMAAAAAIVRPPTIEPRLRMDQGRIVGVVLPGEPGFDELGAPVA